VSLSNLEEVALTATACELFGFAPSICMEIAARAHASQDWQKILDRERARFAALSEMDLLAYAIGAGIPRARVGTREQTIDILSRAEAADAIDLREILEPLRNRGVL
jgi:hypothetical protein